MTKIPLSMSWSTSVRSQSRSTRLLKKQCHRKLKTVKDLLCHLVLSPFAYLSNSIDPGCQDLLQFFGWEQEENFVQSFKKKRLRSKLGAVPVDSSPCRTSKSHCVPDPENMGDVACEPSDDPT
jgi:hypothetical protein